jgi:hypothetical protein
MMLGYARAGFLRGKDNSLPNVEDNDDERHIKGRRSGHEDKAKQDDPGRQMDESGQRSKRAIARPLKIQPGIHSTEDSSSKRPVARA